MFKEYEVKFEMIAFAIGSGCQNIIHLTAGGHRANYYGDRNPGIWLCGGGSPHLHICSAVNGHWANNQDYDEINGIKGIPTNTWIAITVAQRFENGHFNYTIQINGTLTYAVENKRPIDLTDVQVYASLEEPMNGAIRRLEVSTRAIMHPMFFN